MMMLVHSLLPSCPWRLFEKKGTCTDARHPTSLRQRQTLAASFRLAAFHACTVFSTAPYFLLLLILDHACHHSGPFCALFPPFLHNTGTVEGALPPIAPGHIRSFFPLFALDSGATLHTLPYLQLLSALTCFICYFALNAHVSDP